MSGLIDALHLADITSDHPNCTTQGTVVAFPPFNEHLACTDQILLEIPIWHRFTVGRDVEWHLKVPHHKVGVIDHQ